MFFGDHNTTTWDEIGQFHLEADQIIIHENYTDDAMNFDVCLLRTSNDIISTSEMNGGPGVQIACLPQGPAEHGKACWVGGWGHTEYEGSTSDVLMSVGVNIFSAEYCRQHRHAKSSFFNVDFSMKTSKSQVPLFRSGDIRDR